MRKTQDAFEMSNSESGRQNRDKSAIVIVILILLSLIPVSIFIIRGYLYGLDWVGVANYKTGEIKSLWDWMELFVIPIFLAIAAHFLGKSEKAHERKIAAQQRENERVLASRQAEVDQKIARDRLQQTALEAYFDRMTDLLLDKALRASKENDEVRIIARTITLTVLRGLNGNRRGQVLQFLYEAGLIVGDTPIVDLSHADLSGIDLPYARLEKVNVSRTNLRRANLQSANLRDANFCLADLDEANLSWAHLEGANLQCGLLGTNLGVARLDGASLFNANLAGASLINASLVGADLRSANFKYINEGLGDLEQDNIRYAELALADFSDCDLTNATLDVFQFGGSRSLVRAIMPDGTKFEEWIKLHRDELRNS